MSIDEKSSKLNEKIKKKIKRLDQWKTSKIWYKYEEKNRLFVAL